VFVGQPALSYTAAIAAEEYWLLRSVLFNRDFCVQAGRSLVEVAPRGVRRCGATTTPCRTDLSMWVARGRDLTDCSPSSRTSARTVSGPPALEDVGVGSVCAAPWLGRPSRFEAARVLVCTGAGRALQRESAPTRR